MSRNGLPGDEVLRLPVTKPRPKGLAPWTPRPGSKNARILSAAEVVLARYEAEGRWPLGSREVGYVLTGEEFGFTKDDIDLVENVLVRARRAGLIPWEAISDGRTGSAQPWTVDGPEELAQEVLDEIDTAQLDRQAGQRHRVEVWAEAVGWLPRLERDCNERGVSVYSGSGSIPVPAIRSAVIRAINAWSDSVTSGGGLVTTVLLQLGDLDLNGIRNIARPFADDIEAFAIDLLARDGTPPLDALGVRELIVVRRLLLTAEQVELHIGERGRAKPTREAIRADWPYPFTAQAEALPPEIRDQIVADAIDALHDVGKRDELIATEAALHADARAALARKLGEGS